MEFNAGELIRIECETEIKGVFDDPTTMQISIMEGSRTGSVVQAVTPMTNDSLGHWSYMWDSTGMSPGKFHVKLHGIDTTPGNWDFEEVTLI